MCAGPAGVLPGAGTGGGTEAARKARAGPTATVCLGSG